MLLYKEVPKETIEGLRKGHYYEGLEIINIQRWRNVISIVTRNGDVFNAHDKWFHYNVFVRRREN
jgi:hypothetical protein